MQVKTGELKTHLSHYLRLVQETGEEIEVCVRDQPVAYLTRAKEDPMTASIQVEQRQLEAAFQSAGLVLSLPTRPAEGASPASTKPKPSLAGDGRVDVDSVEEMRRQGDW